MLAGGRRRELPEAEVTPAGVLVAAGTGRGGRRLAWQVRLLGLGGLSSGNLQVTPKGCGSICRISVSSRWDKGGTRGAPGQGAPVASGQRMGKRGLQQRMGEAGGSPWGHFKRDPLP